jgi:hypothetical protein
MSERANGWLLIVGGLAIGLVLWLSPSQSAPSRSFASMARQRFGGLLRRVAEGRGVHARRAPTACMASGDPRIKA